MSNTIEKLADDIRYLESACDPDTRLQAAQALLASARESCNATVDLSGLTDAGSALLTAFKAAEEEDNFSTDLAAVGHEFADLARLKPIRQAAYPAETDQPGGRWLDVVMQLIDRTDFTVGRMFRQRVSQFPDKTVIVVPRGESVEEFSLQRVFQATEQIARAILALLGDDPVVAIYTPNRIEGALIDLACLTNGIFNTMVPANSVESQIEHILVESGTRMLIVSGADQLRRALAIREAIPALEWIVTLDALPTVSGMNVIPLSGLLERADEVSPGKLEERLSAIRSSTIATTMYTSGTTGLPKGITFSHLNLVSKRYARVAALPELDENEVFLCFLPLYHTFGRYLELLGAIHLAATYVFAESASTETLIHYMKRFHPTAMISVPKKWVNLHARIATSDEPPGDPEVMTRSVRELTGGNLRWGLSAAGRLDPEIFRFFQRHGVDLLSGYGMTEATGGITMTPPGQYIDNSIGRVLPGIELGFGEDHELKLRGPYVTTGYTNPEDSATAFRDGWFYTGDVVSVDEAGYLRHVDRKKDIYKNASGRTIAPQRIEALFADFPEVSRVFAVGDGREYVTLLIRPNLEYAEIELGRMSAEAMREYFRGLVVSCNRFLAPFERVVNFALLERDFLLDEGELTPKGSFRRAAVEDHFRQVIDPMYVSSTTDRVVDGLRIKIPIPFLQQIGATEAGTCAEHDGLLFRAIDRKLRIRRDPDVSDRVWIGNCCYRGVGAVIELDDWLRLPELWAGNADLTQMTGDNILLWSLSSAERATPSTMVGVAPSATAVDEYAARLHAAQDAVPSLLTVHAAAVCLASAPQDVALQAVDYLTRVLTTGWARHQELSGAHLRYAAHHQDIAVRSRAFVALFEHEPAESFEETASVFCESLQEFLDDEACARMAQRGFSPDRWPPLSRAFAALRRTVSKPEGHDRISTADSHEQVSSLADQFVAQLLHSLGRIADRERSYYIPVRRELIAWMLAPVSEALQETAAEVAEELTLSFRRRLGDRQTRAVDPESGHSYTWGDTLRFEEGIEPDELDRITGALCRTNLIREAVLVLHRDRKINLDSLAPGSIWISMIRTRFGRGVYHVGVRLRSGERCDFMLYVRSTAPLDTFLTDLRLMCLAAGVEGETPLTPQLGGYWPEYGLATVTYISVESVEAMVRHMHEHPDHEVRQRLRASWHHLCWSALAAAFEFHRRTEGRWVLSGSLARVISVPLNDFDESARVFSVAGWHPFAGRLSMILDLKRGFLDRIRFHFPELATEMHDEILFGAAVEVFGLRDGVAFLEQATTEPDEPDAPVDELDELRRKMTEYAGKIRESGYMPKALHFAIARYRAWTEQVPDAGAHARAAQLRELENNYHIHALTRRFPESQLWLYAETVLHDSPAEGRRTIAQAMNRLREGAGIKEVLGRLYQDLRRKLARHDQQYFLTRAAYPHLELDEKAELITTSEVGQSRAELVTLHTDRAGGTQRIRPAANAREVDRLYRIFYTGGLGGGYREQENLLIALDEAEYVIGGVAYIRRTPSHVLLERIAVLPRCRGRGIGQLLINEFLRRQRADGVSVVSAEFIRATWLAQFGFKSHPRYAGVVCEIGSKDHSTGSA